MASRNRGGFQIARDLLKLIMDGFHVQNHLMLHSNVSYESFKQSMVSLEDEGLVKHVRFLRNAELPTGWYLTQRGLEVAKMYARLSEEFAFLKTKKNGPESALMNPNRKLLAEDLAQFA